MGELLTVNSVGYLEDPVFQAKNHLQDCMTSTSHRAGTIIVSSTWSSTAPPDTVNVVVTLRVFWICRTNARQRRMALRLFLNYAVGRRRCDNLTAGPDAEVRQLKLRGGTIETAR
jgi:hypothetical protein